MKVFLCPSKEEDSEDALLNFFLHAQEVTLNKKMFPVCFTKVAKSSMAEKKRYTTKKKVIKYPTSIPKLHGRFFCASVSDTHELFV